MTGAVRRVAAVVPALLCALFVASPVASAAPALKVGVLAYRPAAEAQARWEPLAGYLAGHLPGARVHLQAYSVEELNAALDRNELDFMLTNPGHYIEVRQRTMLSSVLATLVTNERGAPVGAFGGVVFARASRPDLTELADLRDRRLAISGYSSFGGFLAPAYELFHQGLPVPRDRDLLLTGMPHDGVVEAVLEGRADAGFVRTGVLEAMEREGRLDRALVKVLGARELPGFPLALSTHLYPEWPFVVLPHVPERTASRVAAALLGFEAGSPLADLLGIHGFSVAADYTTVEAIMRAMRRPPFDEPPRVALADIWARHRVWLVALALALVAIVAMTLILAANNRRLVRARADADLIARRLRESEERLQLAINGVNDGIWDVDLRTDRTYYSPKWKEILGYVDTEIANDSSSFRALMHPGDAARVEALMRSYLEGALAVYRAEFRLRHRDGSWRWILARGEAVRDGRGVPVRMVGSHTDVTEQKHAEEQLRLAASVFANSQEGIVITDAQRDIIDVNPAFTRITGYSRDEVLGRNPRMFSSGRQGAAFYAEMWQALGQADHWRGEVWNRRRDGQVFAELLSISCVRGAGGAVLHYVGVFSDISYIKAHEAELDRIAHYDPLTGVPNRRLLSDRLELAIVRAQRTGRRLAVGYLDLDGFKPINDAHGHEAGDKVLVEVTRALRETLRAEDTLARIGGDEFVLLFGDLAHEDEAVPILDRVLRAISAPIRLGDVDVQVSASVGVALFPRDAAEPEILLRHADQAMYAAKVAGKNRVHFHGQEPAARVRLHG